MCITKSTAKSKLREMRILIAEDSWVIADTLAVRLEEEGAFVQGPFGKARDAIAYARENRSHFALVDMSLKDGFADELVEALSSAGVPYAIVTGFHSLPSNAEADAVAVFRKPVDARELIELLTKYAPNTGT